VEVTSGSRDGRWWTVVHLTDDGPARYHLWDRRERTARFLFANRTALEDVTLSRMAPHVVRARDGMELVSYLSLPADEKGRSPERPDEPLPAVLLVHGGPWQRDRWGYDPVHQLLANRGYAVLSVNFRGSTGFGKGFLNAAAREWGRAMHEDLLDAVEWLVAEGIAERSRVGIMGGSYGGYATLVGLTMTPEVFACGVDIVGPSSLVTLIESVPPYWKPQQEIWRQRVGDIETEAGRKLLLERSPLTHVDAIRRPLLIAQGANDPRVKKAESDQIVAAMQERGIPVTYALFPDEGHGFARPENNLAFHALADAFLSVHLGGRAEPLRPADLAGSTLEAPAGAEGVPGLAEALAGRSA
jgi:dipeptidyl aminopeptidase/acylaminoacyl peptidase